VSRFELCHGTHPEHILGRARCAVCERRTNRATPRGPASLVVRRTIPGMFGTVVGLRQAKRALCMWAALEFRPCGRLKLEISFSIFFRFQFEFKL
jgi:hypothetical protein